MMTPRSQLGNELHDAASDLLERVDAAVAQADWSSFTDLIDMVLDAKRSFVSGAGRSGLVARMFGMRLMHAGITAHIPGETITPAAAEGDLLVAISCTGSTGFTDYLAQRAKEFGAKVCVITTEADSPLAKLADHVVTIPVDVNDIVLRAAVFEHTAIVCLDAVFNILSERFHVDNNVFRSRHANLE
ncbi:MAG: SIS domain-containing protein [Phycisphaerales bacterium]|nr:SIS domain-containing protein [Phycisphaerales bacterium]MBT7170524.1 SIS domain-containing protein [Phycisphaerales bacterium]